MSASSPAQADTLRPSGRYTTVFDARPDWLDDDQAEQLARLIAMALAEAGYPVEMIERQHGGRRNFDFDRHVPLEVHQRAAELAIRFLEAQR